MSVPDAWKHAQKKKSDEERLEAEMARAGVPCFNCDHPRGEHSFI
jgi:hypothetical protein